MMFFSKSVLNLNHFPFPAGLHNTLKIWRICSILVFLHNLFLIYNYQLLKGGFFKVHLFYSLLLVDALQTFGPDFELLLASHKHVGMDSMSGSLRDSEPTSPTSPASPDPNITRENGATSPVALTKALSTLATSPPIKWSGPVRNGPLVDAEALITVEVILVLGQEPMQIANVQFNNLDIIGKIFR